jgi:L-aminopeptidase/D-esterase-like protein
MNQTTRKQVLMNQTLTDVPGIRVGHDTDLEHATGCTVILCPPNTVGGVDVRGGAPGTRETDLLRPENLVEQINAIFLSGGSAYGLAVGDGVMQYLAERGEGYISSRGYLVPLVAGAILFDLAVGSADVRPDAASGYRAAQAASAAPVAQGSVGAGTGAICGAARGKAYATKGGLGSASIALPDGLVVAALVAVNAVGDVLAEDGTILAGVRADDGSFAGMLNVLKTLPPVLPAAPRESTVIGVVATNARLSKAHTNRVAAMAHDGIARAVNPAHTMYDGDAIFALATGEVPANVTLVGAFAAEAMSQAIRSAVRHATTIDGVRACSER